MKYNYIIISILLICNLNSAADFRCQFSSLFLSGDKPSLVDVSEVFLSLYRELAPHLLTPAYITALKNSNDPFTIPKGSSIENNTLNDALSDLKGMLETRYDEAELKHLLFSRLESLAVKVGATEKSQNKIDEKTRTLFQVVHKFEGQYGATGANDIHIYNIHGKKVIIYPMYEENGVGTPVVAVNINNKTIQASPPSVWRQYNKPVLIENNGKSQFIVQGKEIGVYDENLILNESKTKVLTKALTTKSTYFGRMLSTRYRLWTSSMALPGEANKVAVVVYSDSKLFPGNPKSTFKIIDSNTAKAASDSYEFKGSAHILGTYSNGNELHFALGMNQMSKLIWGVVAQDGNVTTKEIIVPKIFYDFSKGTFYKNSKEELRFIQTGHAGSLIVSELKDNAVPKVLLDSFMIDSEIQVLQETTGPVGYVKARYQSSTNPTELIRIDLESNKLISRIAAPNAFTDISIVKTDVYTYGVWGQENGQIVVHNLETNETEISPVLQKTAVRSIAPYLEAGEWKALITFAVDNDKKHYAPVIVKLMKEIE